MEGANVDDLLQFQDYPTTTTTTRSPGIAEINVNSNAFQAAPSPSENAGSGAYNGSQFSPSFKGNKGVPFLSLNYYKQFFDVDTSLVLQRITNSFVPTRAARDYLRVSIGENPDLYGPFWVTVTLIFFIAINGNIASYLQHANDNYRWHYNFHLVSYAATTLFVYVNILPMVLWGVLKYSVKPSTDALESGSDTFAPSLLSLICIYGYSLSIYIPISMLWVIQITFLQWCLVSIASLMSGGALITVMTPALRNSKYSLFLAIGILAAHFLLAAGFMQIFFHMPSPTNLPVNVTPTIAAITEAPLKKLIVTTTKQYVGNVI